jgi:hypothetical protein
MIELPFKISSVLSYSVALTTFVVAFIVARSALQWLRRRERRGS